MTPQKTQPQGLIAERLASLMEHQTGPDGRPYTENRLVAALAERGVTRSRAYIGDLKRGHRGNPSSDVLQALAEVFGVPMNFFTDPAAPSWVQWQRILTIKRHWEADSVAAELRRAEVIDALPAQHQALLRNYGQLHPADQAVVDALITNLLDRHAGVPTPPPGAGPAATSDQ